MKTFSSILVYFGLSFVLHLAWETLQAPLFAGFESYAGHFLACLRGAATGDMIFMGVIYLSLAASFRDYGWLLRPSLLREPSTWVLPVIIGPLLAVSFELWAVYAARRWSYDSMMPLVPILKVGWAPLGQMFLIPWASIALSFILLRRLGFVSDLDS